MPTTTLSDCPRPWDETERFLLLMKYCYDSRSNKQLVNLFILSNHVVSWREKLSRNYFIKIKIVNFSFTNSFILFNESTISFAVLEELVFNKWITMVLRQLTSLYLTSPLQ